MLRIRDIMTADVTAVPPEMTIREAMELLAREHVSGVPVVSGSKIVGVVTTADLLAFAATIGGVPAQRESAEEWAEVPEVGPEAGFGDPDIASGAFHSDLWDDAGAEVGSRIAATDSAEWNTLEEHEVSEVMTRALWALPSSADAREAAELMREHSIHRVLVVDDGQLVGIVSALDIAKAAAHKQFTTRAYVFNRSGDFEQRR